MSDHLKGILLAFAGILILSPDTLLVRLIGMEQWPLQFYRGLGLALCLVCGMAALYRGRVVHVFRAVGGRGLITAISGSLASLLFVSAIYHTSVANTLVIISIAPILSALFSRVALGERLQPRTWVAAVLCTSAVAVIMAGDLSASGDELFGDFLALCQAALMATSFVLVRSRPQVNMVPCWAVSGLLLALYSLPMAGSLAVSPAQLPLLALLVLAVLPISFAMLFLAPRHIPAPEVNMIMLLEMIVGPLLVWAIAGEPVPPATLWGGVFLFAVLLWHSALALREGRRGAVRLARTGACSDETR